MRPGRAGRPPPATPDQLTLAQLIETGSLDRHLRRTRATYLTRRNALRASLAEHLPGARAEGVEAGLHLLVRVIGYGKAPEHRIADGVARLAAAYRVTRTAYPVAGRPGDAAGHMARGTDPQRRGVVALQLTPAAGAWWRPPTRGGAVSLPASWHGSSLRSGPR